MLEQVLINCLAEDLPKVEEIKKRLEMAGILYYVQPAQLSPGIQKEMVEKIQAIAAGHGCMVCILSNKSVSDALFVSNIQLMCETARNERVLVYYSVEQLENDQSIRLFASQVYQVRKKRHDAGEASAVIKRINHILHPGSRNLFELFSGIISRKTLSGLLIAVAVLAAIASMLFNFVRKTPPASVPPTPTAVLLYVPFSGQSQDRGLTEDVRHVPDYQLAGDPAAEAPFHFKPENVFEQEDFNDPLYDHTYNKQKWYFSGSLNDVSSKAVTQTNGVLQLAMAPLANRSISLVLMVKYLFNRQQVTYLGYRFRLEDYQGRVDENTSLHVHFFDHPSSNKIIDTVELNGVARTVMGFPLGSRWHAVEMVSQEDRHFIDVYLDGEKINTLSYNDEQLNSWMNYMFAMDITNTTDWTRIQIDEVVFGGDQPIPEALQPEQASYRFTPDSVSVHNDFSSPVVQLIFNSGTEFVTQTNGALSFDFPASKDLQVIRLVFPATHINDDNYYATRFRITSPDNNIWADSPYFFLGINKEDPVPGDGDGISIGLFQGYNFEGHNGGSQGIEIPNYNLSSESGYWHTMEMLIKPPDGSSQEYTAIYWVDGYLVGEVPIQNPMRFLDPNMVLNTYIQISGGRYRQNIYSGEIDDLVIGKIASDKIKE
jgi:hypothetical protein